MKFYLAISLFLFSSVTWGFDPGPANSASCSVKGQSDFTIYFDLYGAFYEQGVEIQQPGNHEDFWVLSTSQPRSSGETAEMYDTDLYRNAGTFQEQYNAAISYNAATNQLNYYRKSTNTNNWGAPLDSSTRVIKNGNIDVVGEIYDTASFSCEDSLPSFGRQYSDDAVFEFGVASCNGGSCNISFDMTFDIVPLVFVMPTIDPNMGDSDAPATLSVTSVTKTGASIIQEVPPSFNGSNSTAMTSISFLVIEPGVAYFDGNKVYADYADISSVSTSSSVSTTNVAFSQIPSFSGFSSTPVVLGQVQSRNNDDKWITTAIENIGRTNVNLGLELSRSSVSNYTYNSEKIAFLATEEFQGTIDSYSVAFNNASSTLDTLRSNSRAPIADSCIDYTTTPVGTLTGIVANKQTRAGSDGGWLRRCDINGNQASFAIDEDTNNSRARAHVSEQVGYFAFYQEMPEIGTCQYFPAPAQSWYAKGTAPNTDDRLMMTNPKNDDYHISGWPATYVYQNSNDNKYYVNTAFDEVSDLSYSTSYSCDAGYCVSGLDSVNKVEVDLEISNTFPSGNLTIEGHNGNNSNSYKRVCEAGSEYCSYDKSGQNITIQILKGMDNLNITNLNKETFTIVFPAKDDFRIRKYEVNDFPVTTVFSSDGNYTFDYFRINTAGNTIKTGADTKIYIRTDMSFNNPIDVIQTGLPDDVAILGPNAAMNIKVSNGSQLKAKILARTLLLENSVLEGAATAKRLSLSQAGAKIIGNSSCFDGSTPTEYQLVLEPTIDYTLVCDTQVLRFEVRDQNGLANSFSGELYATASNGGLLSTDNVTSGVSSGRFQIDNGVLTLYLTKVNSGAVEVIANLVNYSDVDSESGLYQFVPFSFDADIQKVVAGKSQQLSIKVLACDDGSKIAVDNYDRKSVPFIHSLLSPLNGKLGNLDLSNESGTGTPIDFDAGVAEIDITYWESGKSLIQISDPNFDCSGLDGCPIDGNGKLSGAFEIHARPWTFAICDENGSVMGGTSSGGAAYNAAGDVFSLKVMPIVYMDKAGAEEKCNANRTTNFFVNDAESVTVYLRGEKQSPSSGVVGTGSAMIVKNDQGDIVSSGESKLHTDNSGTVEAPFYLFNNLYWNEVGSLMISADIDDISNSNSSRYLDMVIDTGTREIGRFYPHHLTIIEDSDTLWDYADGHNDFAYMGQNIGHSFIVQAESSQDDSGGNALITTNYGLFTDDNIVTVTYKATANIPNNNESDNWVNIESTRILPRDLEWIPSNWGNNTGQIMVGMSDFIVVKNGSTLDGPFKSNNSKFGLISSKIDGVDFESLDFDSNLDGELSGQRFSIRPDFRYGRMVLSDVGGNQGTNISIPLKVEYWDGDQFVVNKDDSGSELNSDENCRQSIWSEVGSNTNVSLELNTTPSTNEGSVSEGQYTKLFAKQGTSRREQFKIWLRQGSNKTSDSDVSCSSNYVDQPWLQYFWNDPAEEEEDPSAIVTFGIYRGNDRVIFRGENRFTGQ
ncbi:DUF6701 domain-containing protein [Vibrio sp. F74]|uniref:DUF6701 domain-containing protein n=1 Tax=Vibrio sp. F74 TaxID=700020 RepID=UPI0036F297C9